MIPLLLLGSRLIGAFPILGIFKGALGKLMIVGLIAAVAAFAWWRIKENIRSEAVNKVFQQQMEQHVKNQENTIATMKQVMDARDQALKEFSKRQEEISRRYAKIIDKINRGTLKNGEVSEVLKYTIDSIRRLEQGVEEAPEAPVGTGNPRIDQFNQQGTQP